jgi:amicyanin
MLRRRHRIPAAFPAAAVAAAAVVLISGCSSNKPSSNAQPSINFGSQATTPGMGGHGSPNTPAATSASTTAAPGPSTAQAGPAVNINNFKFDPATLTVPVGTTVTWTNQDEEPHTVAAGDGSFHSPGLGTNATYSYTFPTAGTFDYICSIHPFMHGTVVVTK